MSSNTTTITTTATPPEDNPVFDDEAITAIIVAAICLAVLIVLIGMCLVTIWYFSVEKRQARKEEKQKEKRRLEHETKQMLDGDDEDTVELGLLGAEGAAASARGGGNEFSAIDISDVEDDDDDLEASKRRNRKQQRQQQIDDGSSSDEGFMSAKKRQSPGREGNTLADYIARSVKGGIPEDAVLEDVGPGVGVRITEVKGLADTLIPIDEAMRRSYFDDFDINVDGKDIPADDTSPEALKRRKDKDAFYKRQEGKLKYIQDLRAKKEEFEKKEGRFKNITAAKTPEEVAAEKRLKLEEEELDRLIEEADKEEDVPLSRAEAERKRIQYLNDREFKRWVLENQEEKSHRVYGGANAEQSIARRLLSTTYYTASDPFRSRAEEAQEERRNREKAQEVAEKLHTLRLKQHQLATQHRALQQRPQTENEDLNKKLRMALAGMTAGLRKLASEIEDVESDLREAAGIAVKSKGGTVDGISNQDLIASLLGAAAAERITRWTSGEEALVGEDEAGAGPARRDQHTAVSTFLLHELPWMTADAVHALAKQVRADNKKQIKAQRGIEPFFQNNGTLDFEHPVSRKQLTDARRNSVMGGAGSDRGSGWGDRSSYDGGGGTRRERGSTIMGSETGSAHDRASSHGTGRTKSVFYGNNSAFDGSDRGSIFGGAPGVGDNFSQGGGGRGGRRKHVEALPNSAFTPQLLKASHEILAEREGMFGPNARAKKAAAVAKAAAEKEDRNSDGEISDDSDDDNERVGRSTNVEFMLGISKQKLVDKRSLAAMREQLVNNVRRLEEELEEEGRDKEHDISLADEQLLQQLSPSARAREAAEGGMRGVTSIKDQKTAARKRAQAEKHAKKCRRKLFKLLILQKRLDEEEVKEAKRKRRNRGRSTVGSGGMNNNASFGGGGDTKSILSGTDRDSSPGSGRGSTYGSGRGSVFGSDRDSRSGFDGGGGGGLGGRENGNDPKTPEDAMAALQRHLEQHDELKKLAVEDLEDEFGAIDDQRDMSSVDASSNDSADGWLNIGKDDEADEREEEAVTKGLGGRVGWVRPEERKWFHTSRSPENRLKGAERVSNAQRLDGEGGGGGGGKTLHDRLLLLEQQEKKLEDARKARRRDERLRSRANRAVEEEDLPEPLPMYEADIEWGRNTYAERMKNKRGGLDETDMLPTRVVRALPRAEDDPYLYLL